LVWKEKQPWLEAGLPDGIFQNKNHNLGKFWRALKWKMSEYISAIRNILRPFGYILWPFGKLLIIWCIFPHFGKSHQEKSGNPDWKCFSSRQRNWVSFLFNCGYVRSVYVNSNFCVARRRATSRHTDRIGSNLVAWHGATRNSLLA
jgi:hypothetical protein